MDEDRIRRLMFRLWWWARVYAIYAAILFTVLWAVANCCCGCANSSAAPSARAAREELLSERLSAMMADMRRAGCWPTGYSLTYANPTNYSITVSGKYYDALDLLRTDRTGNLEKKGL